MMLTTNDCLNRSSSGEGQLHDAVSTVEGPVMSAATPGPENGVTPQRKRAAGLLWFLLVSLGSVHSQEPGPIVNLGFAVSDIRGDPSGEWCAFDVRERKQSLDLNGDRDMEDEVLHVHQFGLAETLNLGLAVARFEFTTADWLMLSVPERSQGEDLNGDLDTDDTVAHVHRLSTGETTNLRLAIGYELNRSGVQVDFMVLESEQGEDLNGDGDTDDTIPHLHDFSTGRTTNLGLAVQLWHAHEGLAVFTVSEGGQQADLNGDGDTDDAVLHLVDFSTGTTSNLGITGVTHLLVLETRWCALSLSEGEHGDLNGDDDMEDTVVHVLDLSTRSTRNLEIAIFGQQGDPVILPHHLFSSEGWLAVRGGVDLHVHNLATGSTTSVATNTTPSVQLSEHWIVFEDSQSGVPVLHVHDLTSGQTRNLGLATTGLFEVSEPFVAFLAEESRQGEDLNGDGDVGEAVVHLHNLETGETLNFELATSRIGNRSQLAAGWLVFSVTEGAPGRPGQPPRGEGRDLNGDGDSEDSNVVHVHSLRTGTTVNLGVDALVDGHSTRWLALGVREEDQGEDLNGDGDLEDRVHHVHELGTAETVNLELAGWRGTLIGDRLAFAVRERDQGLDLNGDGDIGTDDVLHIASLSAFSVLQPFRRGDCNDDGKVDISDAVSTLGSLLLGEGDWSCDDACDSNDDGTVDISDAVATLGVLFLGQGPVPLPGSATCGFDPTVDSLGCEIASECP